MTVKPSIHATPAHFVMPGLATVHSHAFQRALRGRTQRRSTEAHTFWSWRALMYRLVEILDPGDVYDIARMAYAELAMSGVAAVGEFHYLHHDRKGQPYANRLEMAEAVIQAALEVGLRICLIRTAYLRAGFQQTLVGAQRRFFDPEPELVIADAAALQSKYAQNPAVRVALAAHSIRAVPAAAIQILADYAARQGLPFHMHVSEQRRELQESQAEYGVTPVELLAHRGVLSSSFVAVHATHLLDSEVKLLGAAQSRICICRTTERDLGDGLPRVSELIRAGAGLVVGVDSHCCENAFEEIRAVEYDERSRLQVRHAVAEAPFLLDAATRQGYHACGMAGDWQQDRVFLSRSDPALAGLDAGHAADIVLFAATPRAVDRVEVGGVVIVEDGWHVEYQDILQRYLSCLRRLELSPGRQQV